MVDGWSAINKETVGRRPISTWREPGKVRRSILACSHGHPAPVITFMGRMSRATTNVIGIALEDDHTLVRAALKNLAPIILRLDCFPSN